MQSLFRHNKRLEMNMQDVTVQWQAEEKAVRARLAKTTGYARPDQVAGRTGLEGFEAIFSGELPPPPIGDTLDFVPIHIEYGAAVFQGRPNQRHYNPLGTVHGGWFATLLDSAVGCAVHSTLPAGKGNTMTTSNTKGTALITGASRGIGAVYADRLAKRGYDLILVARDGSRLEQLTAKLKRETGRAVTLLTAD